MAAKKSPSKNKTATQKVTKAAAKKKVAKKKIAKKKVVKKAPAKKAATSKVDAPKKETTKAAAKGKFLAAAVNLGHVFALKPRVETSFRQADFRTAKLHLQDEGYETLEDAVRAVAEKALELTLGSGAPTPGGKRR